jgi:hypothetical protein
MNKIFSVSEITYCRTFLNKIIINFLVSEPENSKFRWKAKRRVPYKKELCFMELATERRAMDGGNVGARGFPLSADDCNPLRHPQV